MSDGPDAGALDCSGFIGGRLRIWQPRRGYRAGVEPVLLAAAVPARAGETVLELGLGAGVASLCLGARVPGLMLTGVELQPLYAGLARRNAGENGIALEVIEADISALPSEVRIRTFDHVIANPPFFPAPGRSPAADPGRETGRGEAAAPAVWVATGLHRLRPGGRLTMIQRTARLPELLAALPPLGTDVIPLASRQGRAPEHVIVQHRKGGRAGFRLAPPLILHRGERHEADAPDYAPWAEDCLRHGAALPAQSTGAKL